MGALRTLALLLAATLAIPSTAAADAERSADEPAAQPEGWSDAPWWEQPARWFVAGRNDLGVLYVKPRIHFGYGQPHHIWGGIEVNPTVSFDAAGGDGGLLFDHPWIEIRGGVRYEFSFEHVLLPPRESYVQDDIELKTGPRSEYWTLDGEVELDLPFGPGDMRIEAHGLRILGIEDMYVFDERIDAVVAPPWALRVRAGFAVTVGEHLPTQVGPVGEGIWLPGRDEVVWRAGVITRMTLSHRLEVRGNFLLVVDSPDRLGLTGGEFAELSLRWRWASGVKAFCA